MKLSLSLHILGIVLWVGTLLMLSMIVFLNQKYDLSKKDFNIISKKLFFAGILPGVLLSFGSGLYQILTIGFAHYMKQGWFHGKLTFIIILSIVTFVFSLDIKNIQSGKWPSRSKAMAIHGSTGICLILIIFLTMFGR